MFWYFNYFRIFFRFTKVKEEKKVFLGKSGCDLRELAEIVYRRCKKKCKSELSKAVDLFEVNEVKRNGGTFLFRPPTLLAKIFRPHVKSNSRRHKSRLNILKTGQSNWTLRHVQFSCIFVIVRMLWCWSVARVEITWIETWNESIWGGGGAKYRGGGRNRKVPKWNRYWKCLNFVKQILWKGLLKYIKR